MRTLKLNKAIILNFKGTQKREVIFSNITNIVGPNESGKTTIWDAVNWCITGKESGNTEKFPVKRLDENGKPIENIDVSVELFFTEISETGEFDEIKIKREFAEIWGAEKKGSSNIIFKGNTSNYYWNDAPLKTETEFLIRINDLFGNEIIFKMLTNPVFFSSDAFDWKKRREILEAVAGGELNDDIILENNPDLVDLIASLKKKSLKDIRAEYSNNKKLLKEEQGKIKTRIEEAKLSKQDVPVKQLQEEHARLTALISDIDVQLNDLSLAAKKVNDAKVALQKQIWDIEAENSKMLNTATNEFNIESSDRGSKLNDLNEKRSSLLSAISALESRAKDGKDHIERLNLNHQSIISSIEISIENKKDGLADLRKKFDMVKSKPLQFNPDDQKCALCGRDHDEDVLNATKEKSISNHNAQIAAEKDQINKLGISLTNQIKDLEQQIIDANADHATKLIKYNNEVEKLQDDIKKSNPVLSLLEKEIDEEKISLEKGEIKSIEQRLPASYFENKNRLETYSSNLVDIDVNSPDVNHNLNNEKNHRIKQIKDVEMDLYQVEINNKADARIKELQDQFKEIGVKLSAHDKMLYDTDSYERYKFEELENRVNSKFKLVKFKMFNELQNGGFESTCVATYMGVPYTNGALNTAAKMISGIDIVEALSNHYGIRLPLFLDNRESCTNIQETELQVINLIVGGSKIEVENL